MWQKERFQPFVNRQDVRCSRGKMKRNGKRPTRKQLQRVTWVWIRTVNGKRGQRWRDVSKEERTARDPGLEREHEAKGREDTHVSFLSTRKSIRPR